MAHASRMITNSLIVLVLIGLSSAITPIKQCRNSKPLPLMVQMDDCSELPCKLVKGTYSHMAIQFVATKDSMSLLRASVRLSSLGIQIPFELEEERSNVCANLMFGAYCPLEAGEDVTYHLMMKVVEQQPEVLVKVEVSLLDSSDNSVVACFITDAHVKSIRNFS